MPLRSRKLRVPNLRLFADQLASLADVTRHEHTEGDPEAIENALMERRQFRSTLG